VLYWAVWKLVLPYVFRFRLVPRKEVLEDGTVVTLVRQSVTMKSMIANCVKFSREKVE